MTAWFLLAVVLVNGNPLTDASRAAAMSEELCMAAAARFISHVQQQGHEIIAIECHPVEFTAPAKEDEGA